MMEVISELFITLLIFPLAGFRKNY